jgi:hypothetical protein
MQFTGYPNCCTGHVGYSLGYYESEASFEKFKNEIISYVEQRPHAAFISFTTTEGQTAANKFLLKLGAGHSPWLHKGRGDLNTSKSVRIWWLNIPQFLADNHDPAQPNPFLGLRVGPFLADNPATAKPFVPPAPKQVPFDNETVEQPGAWPRRG